MKRRFFLQAVGGVCALFGIGGGVSVASQPRIQVELNPAGYLTVRGSTEDLVVFHDIFQTHLWPDWKTAKDSIAHLQLKAAIERDANEIRFACNRDTITRKDGTKEFLLIDACEKACKFFRVPFDRDAVPCSTVFRSWPR